MITSSSKQVIDPLLMVLADNNNDEPSDIHTKLLQKHTLAIEVGGSQCSPATDLKGKGKACAADAASRV
jgi:hypothetical protein